MENMEPSMPTMSTAGGAKRSQAAGKPNMLIAVAVLVIVLLAVWYAAAYKTPKVTGRYQAVFLSNNQVYFGQLTDLNKSHAKLNDVFYLRLRQPLQQQQPADGEPAQATQPSLTLIKLGNELHGPVDEMIINRDHILFFEGLKDDGRVVKAIEEFKKQQADQAQNENQNQ